MEAKTEVRSLTPSLLKQLEQILEERESWKIIMSLTPKILTTSTYECPITTGNPNKYTSDHIKLLENASKKDHRTCSEIFLFEWGSSGRVRPRLGHLLYLLKKAELYRAADFVSRKVLNVNLERPIDGPAAKVNILDFENEGASSSNNTINNNLNNQEATAAKVSTKPTNLKSDAMRSEVNIPVFVNRESFGHKKTNDFDIELPSSLMDSNSSEFMSSANFTPDFEQLKIADVKGADEPEKFEEVSDMMKFSSADIKSSSSNFESNEIPDMILNFGKGQ